MTQQRLLEGPSRGAQAGGHRVWAGARGLGDLGHGHALELCQDQHLSLLVVERIEQHAHKLMGLELLDTRALLGMRVGLVELGGGRRARGLSAERAPVIGQDTTHDAEEPGLHPGAAAEVVQFSVHHQEGLLDRIVGHALVGAQA